MFPLATPIKDEMKPPKPPIKDNMDKVCIVIEMMSEQMRTPFRKPLVAIIDSGVHFSPWGTEKVTCVPAAHPSQIPRHGRRSIPQNPHGTRVAQVLYETNPFVDILDFSIEEHGSIYNALKQMMAWETDNEKVVCIFTGIPFNTQPLNADLIIQENIIV